MARGDRDFQTIRSEGALLPPDLLRRILDPKEKIPGTQPQDYSLVQGERLNEVITQSWNRLRKHWAEFHAAAEKLPDGEAGTGLTNDKWNLPLLRELGFGLLPTSTSPEIDGRTYAISRFFGPVPVHLIGCGLSLDHRAPGVRGAAAINPHGLVQEFLNRSPGHLWAILSNGFRLRILRDSQTLSRQSYLEFDLKAMFAGEVYSDFVLFWLVAHATRFAPREADRQDTCWLEQWSKLAYEQGARALGDLRGSVEMALKILGEGFTSHPKNAGLRDVLRSGQLPLTDFHGQLLRVVYRLIFLFVAEDRTIDGQSLLHPLDDGETASLARERYAAHYSTNRLRELASSIKGSRHGDLWRQFQIIVGALSGDENFASARDLLALPTLGSFLWNASSTANLNDSELTNHDFLEALRHLAFTRQDKVLVPVDFRNLGAEELGGVYESLLALTPQISADGSRFNFAEFAGNQRKTSGSYYTPDSLVQCLLDSALDPVVDQAIKGKKGIEAEKAILNLKVCDPAVGSGHFLVGAAHRLARHLARVRAQAQGESEPSPLLHQHALRDVIGRCLYGVDVNPMAAELCRVSLWLEALEPGKPLSFLDHHIQVGNSLLGATPALLAKGIPDEAFAYVLGDEKEVCKKFKRVNKAERKITQQRKLDFNPWEQLGNLAAGMMNLGRLPDETIENIHEKERLYEATVRSSNYLSGRFWADAWCAAFVWKKTKEFPFPITEDIFRRIQKNPFNVEHWMREEIIRLAKKYRFFHWHLAFPEVFHIPPQDQEAANRLTDVGGGFDLVLGNPPWVRQELLKSEKPLFVSFQTFCSTVDSSVLFLERSVQITDHGQRIGLLTPNKWFRAAYGEHLRVFLREQTRVHLLVDFGHSHNLFPEQDTFPAAIVVEPVSERVKDDESLRFVRAHDSDRAQASIEELIATRYVTVPHSGLRADRWQLESGPESRLHDRLMNTGIQLSKYVNATPLSGIKTGLNEAYYVTTDVRNNLVSSDPSCEPLLKRFLRGRDIKRWASLWIDQWHIVIPSSQNHSWPWSDKADETEAEEVFARTYPSIHHHLKRFENALRARSDRGRFWWELRQCDYYDKLGQPKIVVQCIAYFSQFALDLEARYVNNKVLFVPSRDLYLLAILNSRVSWWLIERTFQHMKDDGISVDVQFLTSMPVPTIEENLRGKIENAVRQLIELADDGNDTVNTRLERELELNKLVQDAFGLSPDEVAVLENSLPPRDPIATLSPSHNSDHALKG